MSMPLPKMPLRGAMLLSLLLMLSGCAAREDKRSQIRLYREPPRPVSVQAPVPPMLIESERAPVSEAPKARRLQPAKANKPPQVIAVEPLPAKVAPPVLDNALPEQIYQPETVRQTSLELKL